MLLARRSVYSFFVLMSMLLSLTACGSGGGGGGGGGGSGVSPSSSTSTPVVDDTSQATATRNTQYLLQYFSEMNSSRPEFRYAVYSSRIVLNPNIHVYLNADLEVIESLEALRGSQEIYEETGPMHAGYTTQLSSDASIDLQKIDLSSKTLISPRDVYPAEYPYLPTFDDRMQSAAFSLKASQLTELEYTELLFMKVLSGLRKGVMYTRFNNADDLAIVYTQDEHAYLSSGDTLYDVNGAKVSATDIATVQFVANTTDTWYPYYDEYLNSSSTLYPTVEMIRSSQTDFPLNLLPEEKAIAAQLMALSTNPVTSAEALRYRQMAASMFTSDIIIDSDTLEHIEQHYHHLATNDTTQLRIDTESIYLDILTYASMLSPIADYLSTLVGTTQYTSEFRKYVDGTGNNLWGAAYSMYTIDQGWRMNLGSCVHLSQYSAAALDIAGHEWNRLRSWSHEFIYDQTDGAIYNNGEYFASTGTIFLQDWIIPVNGIRGVQTHNGFRHFYLAKTEPTPVCVFEIGSLSYEDAKTRMQDLYDISEVKPTFAGEVETAPNESFTPNNLDWYDAWAALEIPKESCSRQLDARAPSYD